jgi:hypothetical protein
MIGVARADFSRQRLGRNRANELGGDDLVPLSEHWKMFPVPALSSQCARRCPIQGNILSLGIDGHTSGAMELLFLASGSSCRRVLLLIRVAPDARAHLNNSCRTRGRRIPQFLLRNRRGVCHTYIEMYIAILVYFDYHCVSKFRCSVQGAVLAQRL